jgi:hypothetical protein
MWGAKGSTSIGTAVAGRRPDHLKAPAHLSKSPPVPKPETRELAEEHGGRKGVEPTRYGDWESDGICRDF